MEAPVTEVQVCPDLFPENMGARLHLTLVLALSP